MTVKEELIGHFDGNLKWKIALYPFNSQYLRDLLKNSSGPYNVMLCAMRQAVFDIERNVLRSIDEHRCNETFHTFFF